MTNTDRTTPMPTIPRSAGRTDIDSAIRVNRPQPPGGPRTGTTSSPARFAALVDIENTVIVAGIQLPAPQRQDLFEALNSRLGGMPVRVASGKHVLKACMTEFVSRGWGLTLVPTTPDAADRALIEAGQQFTASGVTDLVVVSGDHAFVPLAALARLHVVTRPGHLSSALRLAATTVTYLPAPQPCTRATA